MKCLINNRKGSNDEGFVFGCSLKGNGRRNVECFRRFCPIKALKRIITAEKKGFFRERLSISHEVRLFQIKIFTPAFTKDSKIFKPVLQWTYWLNLNVRKVPIQNKRLVNQSKLPVSFVNFIRDVGDVSVYTIDFQNIHWKTEIRILDESTLLRREGEGIQLSSWPKSPPPPLELHNHQIVKWKIATTKILAKTCKNLVKNEKQSSTVP